MMDEKNQNIRNDLEQLTPKMSEVPVDPRLENAKFVEETSSEMKSKGKNPLFQAHPLQEVVESQWALDFDFAKEGGDVEVSAESGGPLGQSENVNANENLNANPQTQVPDPSSDVVGGVTEWETHERYSAKGSSPLEMDTDLRSELEAIPEKMAFKIGDVAEIVGVKQYVLRYWEAEFDQVRPKKSKFNQRMYTRKDVETLLLIKKLLYRDRFSMEGARKVLSSFRKKIKVDSAQKDKVADAIDLTQELIRDISVLKHWLKS